MHSIEAQTEHFYYDMGSNWDKNEKSKTLGEEGQCPLNFFLSPDKYSEKFFYTKLMTLLPSTTTATPLLHSAKSGDLCHFKLEGLFENRTNFGLNILKSVDSLFLFDCSFRLDLHLL